MRISDIISLAREYLLLGMAAVAVCAVLYFLGYIVLYKILGKGKRKPPKLMLLWGAVFLCYLVVVFGATMLSRAGGYENGRIMPLFYAYKSAWNSFSEREWRNIILNILLFVPLGFLLPLGVKFFQKFWRTYLAGLALTALIEMTQLLLNRGIFEMDDILNNVLGTMVGYGIFAMVRYFVRIARKESGHVGGMIALQIPLMAVVLAFVTIFTCYGRQELGNIGNAYIMPYDKDLLNVHTDLDLDGAERQVPVYRAEVLTKEQTRELAEHFLEKTGTVLDEAATDVYEDTVVYYGKSGCTLWVNYVGGTYEYTDFSVTFSEEEISEREGAFEEEIRGVLENDYEIEIPEEAEFEEQTEGTYLFTMDAFSDGEDLWDGTLSCTYYENGKMGTIRNDLVRGESYKDFSILSEQEAYGQLCAGKFRYFEREEKMNIEVEEIELDYVADSKGFYQPVYLFVGTVNSYRTEIVIPAICD